MGRLHRPLRPKTMSAKFYIFIIVFFATILGLAKSASIDLDQDLDLDQRDPETLEELRKMYSCYKRPKKTCKTHDRVKCHHKRILNRAFRLCAVQPVEECHTHYQNLCVRKTNKHDLDYALRQYSG